MSNTAPKFAVGSRVRHVKTGRYYRIVNTPRLTFIEAGPTPAYVYQDDKIFWVRPQSEMEDGRFVVVDA